MAIATQGDVATYSNGGVTKETAIGVVLMNSDGTTPGQYTLSRKTADGQVKAGAGFLHTITVSPIGSVTAGVLTIYDSLTETGTVLFSVALPATTFTSFSVIFDGSFATGLFCGFDGTLANAAVTFSYK